MELRRYSLETDLCPGALNIMEPTSDVFADYAAIDVAVIPAMAYDSEGHRLGRGRGYYDRFLETVPHIYKIGVCFDFQKVACVPVESTDVSVDCVV
jgi:5-formyltetrahydrofolate cyclo-ligase